MTAAPSSADPAAYPPVRTFLPRRSRVTARQARALERYWPAYGVPAGRAPLHLPDLFGRTAPVVLEVGFGMGEATAAAAAARPDVDVLAVDVHTPGAGALLHEISERGLANVRVLLGDAVEVLTDRLGPGTLEEIRVFFPDPWPKTRHAKRRLVGPAFAALAASRLRRGGLLHCATDVAPYAVQMLAAVGGESALHNPFAGPAPRPVERPVTRFERQALARGAEVVDVLAYRR